MLRKEYNTIMYRIYEKGGNLYPGIYVEQAKKVAEESLVKKRSYLSNIIALYDIENVIEPYKYLEEALDIEYNLKRISLLEIEQARKDMRKKYEMIKRNVAILYNPLYSVKELYIRTACEIANKLEEVESHLAKVLIDKLKDGAY